MANLVLDFLQGIAQPFETLGKAAASVPEAINREIHNKPITDIQQKTFGTTNQGQIARDIIGSTAQVGLDIAAPGIGRAAASTAGLADASGVAGGAVKGAVEGAAIGGTQGAAQGVSSDKPLNAKNLTLDFLSGATQGAALGGVVGGAVPALQAAKPLDQAGGINNIPKPSDQFAPEDLQKLANSTDHEAVAKQLEPVTGKVVAQEIAPAVAKSNDPHVAAGIIDNSVNRKVEPAVPPVTPEVANPSPAPPEITPPTPTSNINTPAQVAGQSAEEASLFASQPEPSFMNAPGEEAPAASHVGRAGVMADMQDMVNGGQHTPDEIKMHYMQNVLGTNMEDADQAFSEVANSAGVDKSQINAHLNPRAGKVGFAPVKSGDGTAAFINGKYAGEKVGEVANPAVQDMESLNSHDRELTRYLRGKSPEEVEGIIGQAEDQKTFRSYVNNSKDYLDYAQASGAELGQPLPYRVNYGGRTPYDPPQGLQDSSKPNPANPTAPAYTKERYFNTHEEALANGYTPRNEDPLEDLKQDVNQRAYNQTQLAFAKSYEQAYPGQVKMLNGGTPVPSGYHQLIVPGAEHIALPSPIADKINEQIMTREPGKVLGKYDSINQAGKQLELGGGLFHGFNTIGTFVGQQLTSLKALSDPGALGKVVANAFSKDANDSYLSGMSKAPSGGLDENHSIIDGARASRLNLKNTALDLQTKGSDSLAGKISGLPILKQAHAAVFERQIPTMMLEQFRQKTEGLDIFGNADDRELSIKIAQSINKEFGVMDHDIDGFTQRQFQTAGRFLLAPSYQEGQIRTLIDAISKGGVEGRIAREAVFGKALLFGALATAGSAAGGDFKNMTPKQVAMAIMNKAINPSFNIAGYKVSTPATQISNIAKPIEQSIASEQKGKGLLAGPQDFANSHLAFAPSKVTEFAGNKNYQGNAIYGKDYFGRPISGGSVAANLVSGIAPIPLAQTAQTATGQENLGAAIANTVGFHASPQYDLNYAPIGGQTYVSELEKTPGVSKAKIQQTTEFFDLLGQAAKNKNKTIQQAETAINTGNTDKANKVISDYNQKLIQALTPWAEQGGKQYLDSTMLSLLRTAELTYGKANRNLAYTNKTNPTSIGGTIKPLAQQPQPVQ